MVSCGNPRCSGIPALPGRCIGQQASRSASKSPSLAATNRPISRPYDAVPAPSILSRRSGHCAMLCPVIDAPTADDRAWWRLPDTPVPGASPSWPARSSGSSWRSCCSCRWGARPSTRSSASCPRSPRPGPLSAQAANLNNSLAPDRPWLDLTYQLLRIGFALVPVALAAYLLVRSGTRVRDVWARGGAGRRGATWGAAHGWRWASARSASCSTSRPSPWAPT